MEVAAKMENKAKLIDIIVEEMVVDAPVDKHGNTLLILAADNGDVELVELLLKHGADIDIKVWDETALSIAVSKRRTEIVKLLLSHDADPLLRVWIDSTALTYAKNLGYYNIAAILSAARQQLAVSVPLAQH